MSKTENNQGGARVSLKTRAKTAALYIPSLLLVIAGVYMFANTRGTRLLFISASLGRVYRGWWIFLIIAAVCFIAALILGRIIRKSDNAALLEAGEEKSLLAEGKKKASESTDSKAADSKADENKPADIKPADSKPADNKPADSKPVDSKSTDIKPVDSKPVDSKSIDIKPVDNTSTDIKPVDSKPADIKLTDSKSADNKSTDSKPVKDIDKQIAEIDREFSELGIDTSDGKDTKSKKPTLFCPECGAKLVEGAAFCMKCGKKLG